MPAPVHVSHNLPASGNHSTSTSPKVTNTFDVQAGDLIVVKAALFETSSGVLASVTPSASGGSVTWTLRDAKHSAGSYQPATFIWTGLVGTAATGITVSLANPWSTGAYGFCAGVWRGHGGVGNVFSGLSGSVTAPSVAQTCSANSAVDGIIGDFWANSPTNRAWLSINGAPIAEDHFYYDQYAGGAYAGYRTDIGAAGSKTFGMSAPTMKWTLSAVEILAGSGGGAPPEGGASGLLDWGSVFSGSRKSKASSVAAYTLSSALTGERGSNGGTTGQLHIDSTVSCSRDSNGGSAGQSSVNGSFVGYRAAKGGFTDSVTFSEAVTTIRESRGQASGLVSWVSNLVGRRSSKSNALGNVNFDSYTSTTAPGEGGGASGRISWGGVFIGRRSSSGGFTDAVTYLDALVTSRKSYSSASGLVSWASNFVGRRKSESTVSGTVDRTSTSSGSAPEVGASASGSVAWGGLFVGRRASSGSASGGLNRGSSTNASRASVSGAISGVLHFLGGFVGLSIGEHKPIADPKVKILSSNAKVTISSSEELMATVRNDFKAVIK